MESLTLSLLQKFFISLPLASYCWESLPNLSEVGCPYGWVCPSEWALERCSHPFMAPGRSCTDQSFKVGWMEARGQKTRVPLYFIILIERAWICPGVWLMPTQLYFYIFSLNNCKLFITNSSCSIFAWNHKNKQHKISPQTCFTLQSDFRALQRMQNMQSSPLLFGRKKAIIRYFILSWIMIIVPKGSHSSQRSWLPQVSCSCPSTENMPSPWLPLPHYAGKLTDIWSLHLYQFLKH